MRTQSGEGSYGQRKVALVSSVGGHLTDLLALRAAYEDLPHFYVFNDRTQFTPPEGIAVYTVEHAERDARVLWNLVEFARIFLRERPTVMLSTGAGLAVPAAIVAKAMGIRVVYVETSSATEKLSLTGILMQPLADAFFVHWPALASKVKGGRYCGGVFGLS